MVIYVMCVFINWGWSSYRWNISIGYIVWKIMDFYKDLVVLMIKKTLHKYIWYIYSTYYIMVLWLCILWTDIYLYFTFGILTILVLVWINNSNRIILSIPWGILTYYQLSFIVHYHVRCMINEIIRLTVAKCSL